MTTFRIIEPALVPEEFCSYCPNCAGAGSPMPDECCVTCFDNGIVLDEAKIRAALDQPCGRCGGSGRVEVEGPDGLPVESVSTDCPECHGSGKLQIPGVQRIEGD